jgi:hypothetical protein
MSLIRTQRPFYGKVEQRLEADGRNHLMRGEREMASRLFDTAYQRQLRKHAAAITKAAHVSHHHFKSVIASISGSHRRGGPHNARH